MKFWEFESLRGYKKKTWIFKNFVYLCITNSGVEQWQLVGLITQRSEVRILPPQQSRPSKGPFRLCVSGLLGPGLPLFKRKQLSWQSMTLPRSGSPVRIRSFAQIVEQLSGRAIPFMGCDAIGSIPASTTNLFHNVKLM